VKFLSAFLLDRPDLKGGGEPEKGILLPLFFYGGE